MRSLRVIFLAAFCIIVSGCAHQINITPPLNTLQVAEVVKVDKTVGYFIPAADLAKQVTTPGGGGDQVRYLPYKESEPALSQVLSNTYTKVVAVPSLQDTAFLTSNNIAYVFVPTISTTSSSKSPFTWPPTSFTMNLQCKALDATGNAVWEKQVEATGAAEFSEFKQDFSLAARRASKDAFLKLQREIAATPQLR